MRQACLRLSQGPCRCKVCLNGSLRRPGLGCLVTGLSLLRRRTPHTKKVWGFWGFGEMERFLCGFLEEAAGQALRHPGYCMLLLFRFGGQGPTLAGEAVPWGLGHGGMSRVRRSVRLKAPGPGRFGRCGCFDGSWCERFRVGGCKGAGKCRKHTQHSTRTALAQHSESQGTR